MRKLRVQPDSLDDSHRGDNKKRQIENIIARRLAITAIGVVVGITSTSVLAQSGAIPMPRCDRNAEITVRYARTSRRVYVENANGQRGGCAWITDVYNAIKHTTDALLPVYPSNSSESPYRTGIWLLSQHLYVLDGVTLNVSEHCQAHLPHCCVYVVAESCIHN